MPDQTRVRIEAIETEIEALEAGIESCRKTIQLGKALVLVGGALVCAGVWRGDGLSFVAGVSAAIGGVVLTGSTEATRRERLSRLTRLEEERTELIGGLGLTVVH